MAKYITGFTSRVRKKQYVYRKDTSKMLNEQIYI